MKMKTIVDTSVWIEYLKNRSPIAENLDHLLMAGNIFTVGPVVSELLQGAKTEKDYQLLKNSIDGLPFIEATFENWTLAGEISYKLRRKGITLPITDCVIAALAIHHNASVMTYDRHFANIPNLKLVDIAEWQS
jgi:tRNA(fMet)-specific endonuclease VapC